MRDPMAMRPFFGYNAGKYLEHWLNVGDVEGRKMPKVFHVNWFRKSQQGKFLWPGELLIPYRYKLSRVSVGINFLKFIVPAKVYTNSVSLAEVYTREIFLLRSLAKY